MRVKKWINRFSFAQRFALLGLAFFICILSLSAVVMSDFNLKGILTGSALLFCFGLFASAFAYLFISFSAGLEDLRGQLSSASDKMLGISNNASDSSFKLAAAAAEQSTAIYQSISNMEEMESKLSQAVKHSAEALTLSQESLTEALDGKVVIDSLSVAMLDIEESTKQLEGVNQLVQEIKQKTTVINDIVYKTQLLSFNASIEAARAGQYGRGFSVVAAEIGKLAVVSGEAAKDINKLLGDSATKVAEIVGSTKHKVGKANSMSQKCSLVFESITDRAVKVKVVMKSITETANEQEVEMQAFSHAMSDLRSSAGETNKLAHASSKLSGTLRAHSQLLARTLDSLQGAVQGQAEPAPPSAVDSGSAIKRVEPDQDEKLSPTG